MVKINENINASLNMKVDTKYDIKPTNYNVAFKVNNIKCNIIQAGVNKNDN